MSIGSRIKEARKNLKVTQEELASMIGVTKGAIANYENEVSTPRVELMFKLFEVLKCDANFLYQDDFNLTKNQTIDIYATDEQQLLSSYNNLNSTGKAEAIKRVEELTYIDRYIEVDNNTVKLKDVNFEKKQQSNTIRVPARGGHYDVDDSEKAKEQIKKEMEQEYELDPEIFRHK